MVKHHYGLPSLKMIGTFEAAGRLKSFKDAADELHVTPGAVSHQIRSLEQELDMKLFLRESRAVNLTPEGKDLFEVVSSSLNEIGQTVKKLREFYGNLLGCTEGRSTDTWVDFDFFGHQISLHIGKPFETMNTGKVGDHMVPMPHIGIILSLDNWLILSKRLINTDLEFEIPPQIRFEGEPGEQRTMFFRDPSGNPIEIKGFKNFKAIFEA